MLISVTLACSLVVGCVGMGQTRDARSGNPLDRARAAVTLADQRDTEAVHALVDLLDDPDAGVRFYAIGALRRLCGNDFGYRYYADAVARQISIETWREAIRRGELTLTDNRRDDLASITDTAP